MEIPKENIHLHTSRLMNFLNLRRKIKGYVEEYTKKEKKITGTDFSSGTVVLK